MGFTSETARAAAIKQGSARSEEEITTILMGLVAWAGNASAASRFLKSEKSISISPQALSDWKTRYGDRYDALREQYSAQLEGNLAHEYRDVARLALEAERLAIDKATARLKSGDDQDPGRTAANLSRVAQSSTDKLLSLTGRPTQITENRGGPEEILRSLINMGLFRGPEEQKQIEGAHVEEASDAGGG